MSHPSNAYQQSLYEAVSQSEQALLPLLRRLPKVELHAHLTGCLRLGTVRDIIQKFNIPIPASAREDLHRALVLMAPAKSFLSSFAPWRRVLNRIIENPGVLRRSLLEVAEDFAADGIVYAELRVSPFAAAARGEIEHFFQELNDGLSEAYETHRIRMVALLGITRHSHYHLEPVLRKSLLRSILRAAEPYRHSAIVGFDLWGNEGRYPPKMFTDDFSEIRNAGYQVAIHAGEAGPSSFVAQAIEDLGARRVGHGLTAVMDDALLTMMRERRIHVESCITSNVLTRSISDLRLHPVKVLRQKGIQCSLCADNTLVYNTTLSRDYAKALLLNLVSPKDVAQMQIDAMNAAFAPSAEKDKVVEIVEQEAAHFPFPELAALLGGR